MDTCEFSYISLRDSQPKHALGIERSWDELKGEFGCSGPGYPGATYFKTISVEGPRFFASVNDARVFYHDQGKWHPYITAKDIKFGMLHISGDNPTRATADRDPSQTKEWLITYRDRKISFDDYD